MACNLIGRMLGKCVRDVWESFLGDKNKQTPELIVEIGGGVSGL